ncbi:axin interactor, dorsalization-associated protein-like [Dendronephthya gigantea]|uniref:axin interactor, dorsalization-associated protein-like n=1 Tax=Dendronephthya gigantea TaxID=151771 RepID=UPI00106CCA80|nr:axin interactor, dorsalization-associated protein-like [Dendronephthya gigantea]
MTNATLDFTVNKWRENLVRGKDFDTWGQFVEASEEYHRLSRQLSKQLAPEEKLLNVEQKEIIAKVAACLHLRSRFLQNLQDEEITLDDIRQLCLVLENILSEENEIFPIKVDLPEPVFQTNNNLILEEEVQKDQESSKDLGKLLPRIPYKKGYHRLTIKIVKIGLKDTSEFINPFITVSVKGPDNVDITVPQNTPTAKRKEDRDIHFDSNVELQTAIEDLPEGSAIFFEFYHFKPKKKRISTKCWTFMELDEIRAGSACLELYKKPTNFGRKKFSLLTIKALYLHVFLVIHDDVE